ncbi:MAG: PAS domain S-box protein [Halomonadaceae bacterium]|nr:MAG: PAS domain S-box protein [Halomonadaceae bacterium]
MEESSPLSRVAGADEHSENDSRGDHFHHLRQQLKDQTLRSQTIVAHAIDGIITINHRGIVESFNPAAERILGYPAEAVVGKNIKMLMPEPIRGHHDGYIRNYQQTGEKKIIGIGREVTGLHRDGHTVELNLAIAELTLEGQQLFVGFLQDISHRKKAEREAHKALTELAHMNRLGSMGELSAGLAHEISQPLTAIHTTAQACLCLIESGQGDSSVLQRPMEQILQQSRRASEIINELRRFLVKERETELTPEQPNQLISNVLLLLAHEIRGADITLKTHLSTPLKPCLLNRTQIEQVLFNLIRNAIDAMHENNGERILSLVTDWNQNQCIIEIRDNGPGINSEDMNQLFDPFFTTKAHGMGQGLSICRSIMTRHGGQILASNNQHGGAIFRLTLPCQQASTPAWQTPP